MSRRSAALRISLGALLCLGMTCAPAPPPEFATLPFPSTSEPISFREHVQPILEKRCSVCHGCYDAPCQLDLGSYAGIDRGATKLPVYNSSRLTAAPLTRLGIDAHTSAEWREREFFDVLETGSESGTHSLLLMMLSLGRAAPPEPNARLPLEFPLDINRELSCPTDSEFADYARDHPHGGMPYGMAPLSDQELGVLAGWVKQGAAPPAAPAPPPSAALEQVARWEAFLNGTTLKQRITARYLYEHWFLAHLYFEDLPTGSFFRIVRSSTPPGTAVREIATRRPYDDPGVAEFWYRLIPIEATLTHKTHITYALGESRLHRLSELFLASSWEPAQLPEYDPREGSNPFATFAEIPARARYQFLLDDAQYFVMTFIRGPVCHGQVAVSVIEDRFFIAFLDPDSDMSVIDADFLPEAIELLRLPGENRDEIEIGGLWLKYAIDQRRYLDVREKFYDKHDPNRLGPTLEAIWDGDGDNTNALLTVFRHFDNATVVRGFVGGIPKTAWVIDFPLFERIYYDLVANFDVFGNVTHQISTRLYMDHLRMQSENLFLAFLPAMQREKIRESWYVGATSDRSYKVNEIHSTHHATQIPYRTGDVVRELLERIVERNPAVSGPPDLLNRCGDAACDDPNATALEQRAERTLRRLTDTTGPWVAHLPEMSFLVVRDAERNRRTATYTLVHDRAHTNVAAMFDEDKRLIPEQDTLAIVRGYLGSYPNFIFDVRIDEIDRFASQLESISSEADLESFVEHFGVRRTSPVFWETVDWLHEDARRDRPTEAALFDFGRYQNL